MASAQSQSQSSDFNTGIPSQKQWGQSKPGRATVEFFGGRKLRLPLRHPTLIMAEIWQAVGRVFDAVKSPFTMPLKLRPTGLGSGIDKDRPDYTVYCVEWGVGRIYQTRGGPDSLRWFWSMTQRPDDASGSRGSLEEANNKAQFQKSWAAWKAWAKLEEVP